MDMAQGCRIKARQSAKGQKGGKASGIARMAANEDKRSTARLMAARGMTQKSIANELGVSDRTIRNWLNT